MDLQEGRWGEFGLDSLGPGQGQALVNVAVKPSGSIKCREFFD